MRIKIITLTILLLSYNLTFSQKKCKIIDEKDINKVVVNLNARTGIIENDNYPPYEVNENGYIILEIEDINLFRYNITISEFQNNVINSTKLSEGNTQINIDPTVFNLSDLNLDIEVMTHAITDKTKKLRKMEKEIDKLYDKKNKLDQEFQINESKYFDTKSRLNHILEIDTEILILNANLDNLTSIDKGDRSKDQINKINQINKEITKLTLDRKTHNLRNNIKKDSLFINDFETNIKIKHKQEIFKLEDTIADKIFEYKESKEDDSTDDELKQSYNTALKKYVNSINELNEISDFYQRLINLLYSDQSYQEINNQKIKLTNNFLELENVSRDDILKYSYEKLRNIDIKFFELSEAYSRIHDKTENIKATFNKISISHNQINTNVYHKFFQQLAKVYDAINETNFTLKYQTLILSDNADLIKFNFVAEPHSNIPSSVETQPINFNYDVKIKGGLKLDVSTGLFWNFGVNDNSYRFQSISDSTTKVIKEGNENVFIPSFGFLINAYERSNNNFKIGGNFGVSTNTERLNYYLGASLLIGRSERVNLNFGIVGAQVKTVSDMYNTEEILNIPIADLPNEVPLMNPNPFKVGLYFGLTFNLLDIKNKESLSKVSKL